MSRVDDGQSAIRRLKPTIMNNLLKNPTFNLLMNKHRGKANDRFYNMKNDFIDTYELNELSAIYDLKT